MTEETLRDWADGRLSHAEEREVYRWLVRSTAPELPDLLHGMLRERREREADARMAARGSPWARLVDHWNALFATGGASWAEPGFGLVTAAVAAPTEPWVQLVEEEGTVAVRLAPTSLRVAVFVTDDDGSLSVLHAAGPPPAAPLSLGGVGGPRPTLWVFRGRDLGKPTPDAASLESLLVREDVEAVALRWRD